MSKIIFGIGEANFDFKLMNMLDGDAEPIFNSKGECRKRDIVQFAQFNKFKINYSNEFRKDLGEEVLKGILGKIEYYQNFGKFIE